jgi:hypothetical protein
MIFPVTILFLSTPVKYFQTASADNQFEISRARSTWHKEQVSESLIQDGNQTFKRAAEKQTPGKRTTQVVQNSRDLIRESVM